MHNKKPIIAGLKRCSIDLTEIIGSFVNKKNIQYKFVCLKPMKFKFYEYEKCSTCVKARKWLSDKNLDFQRIPIREDPPNTEELQRLLSFHGGERKKLLNTLVKIIGILR